MSASIGSAALVLTTDSAKMTAGAGKAASEVKSKLGAATSGLGGMFGGLGGLLKAGLVGGAVAAGAGAVAVLKSAFEHIGDTALQGKMADSLGVTSEAFTGLAGAAEQLGVDSKGVFEGLTKLSSQSAAALKGGDLGATFRKLGIDVQSFSQLNPADQFTQLHSALQGVTNPAERVRLLMATMGEESGKKLAPLLSKSSEELAKLTGQFAVSGEQMKKIQGADEAFKKVQAGVGAMFRQVVVAMAPLVESVSSKLIPVFEKLQPVLDWVFRGLGTHWGIIIDIIGEVVDGIGSVVSSVAGWIGEMTGLSTTSLTVQDVVTNVWKAIGTAGAYAWDAIKAGAGFVAIGISKVVEGLGAVVDKMIEMANMAKGLPKELKPPGMDDWITGLTVGNVAAQKIGKDIGKWGTGAVESFGQSAKKVEAWFAKRDAKKQAEVKKGGLFDAAATQEAKYITTPAALKGSKEAYSIEARFRTENMLNPQLDLQRKQFSEQQKANELARTLIGAVERIPSAALSIF